jgi:hypothetical protein
MFAPVKHRLTRPFVYLLVAAQLLLSVPVTAASAAGKSDHATAPCAGEMTHADDSSKCPCCPDGVSMDACLATCVASVAVAPAMHAIATPAQADLIAVAPIANHARFADPPLKPPPIA